jgi:hypothetical protein
MIFDALLTTLSQTWERDVASIVKSGVNCCYRSLNPANNLSYSDPKKSLNPRGRARGTAPTGYRYCKELK